MNIEIITTIILFSYIFFIIYLERVIPYTPGKPILREGFWLDFFWYTVVQSYFLKILIFDYIIAPSEVALGVENDGYISHWHPVAIVLFFLITHDFYIYWFHRLQHHSKFFWRTHEAHHSPTTCDWLAGSRSNVLEIIINQTIEFAPIIFLLDTKTALWMVPVKALLDAVWGIFIHANIDVKLGKLGYVINGPEYHQWHHAEHQDVYYLNYSTKFSIWDWIFKTVYNPNLKKPEIFGLPYRIPKDYFMQHVFSVWRFDVEKLESNPIYQKYDNLRVNLLRKLKVNS